MRAKVVMDCRPFRLTCVAAMCCLFGCASERPWAIAPEEILAALRARDAKIDSAVVTVARSSSRTTEPFPAWKYPEMARENGWGNEKPEAIDFTYMDQLIVRGREVTFVENLRSQKNRKGGMATMGSHQHWGNRGGVMQELSVISEAMCDHVVEIRPITWPVLDPAQQHQMMMEMALGVGIGRRMERIESLRREGKLTVVMGWSRLSDGPAARVEAALDDDLVARRVTVAFLSDGWVSDRWEATSDGSRRLGGVVFAASGRFRRTLYGEPKPLPSGPQTQTVEQDFQVTLEGFRGRLSNAEYEALTVIDVLPGMQVSDRVNGRQYIKGKTTETDKELGVGGCRTVK